MQSISRSSHIHQAGEPRKSFSPSSSNRWRSTLYFLLPTSYGSDAVVLKSLIYYYRMRESSFYLQQEFQLSSQCARSQVQYLYGSQ